MPYGPYISSRDHRGDPDVTRLTCEVGRVGCDEWAEDWCMDCNKPVCRECSEELSSGELLCVECKDEQISRVVKVA
jgi:hypothetical protein